MQTDTRENILFVRQFSTLRSRMIVGRKIAWNILEPLFGIDFHETINHEN